MIWGYPHDKMETSTWYIQESEILSRINRNCVSLSPILTLTHSPCFQIVSKSFARVSSRIPLLEAQRQKRGPTSGDSGVTIDWPGLWSLNSPGLDNQYIYMYIYVYVCMYVCLYVCVYIYIIHTYTYNDIYYTDVSCQKPSWSNLPFGKISPILALGLPHFSPPARLGPLRRTRASMAETRWWLRNCWKGWGDNVIST